MKRIFAAIVMITMAFTLAFAAEKKDAKAESNVATVVYTVAMHCESCQARIEKNLAFEKGVKDLRVSFADKTVTVTFRTDKTDSETLRKAIEKLGYSASPAN